MKDKSLEEIDILKLLIYIFSFISICTALILFLLLPILKEYKQLSLKENTQSAILIGFNSKLQSSRDKISLLRTENNHTLEQFDKTVDLQILENFLNKYMSNVDIKELKIENKEAYLKKIVNIKANIDNPSKFYLLINALENFDNLVKIIYPISLEAQKNKNIALSFNLKIYSAN